MAANCTTTNVRADDLPAGSYTEIPLPAPRRGSLRRLVVKQVSGTPGGFTIELFDRQGMVTGAESQSDTDQQEVPEFDPELHRIILQTVIAAGIHEKYDYDHVYENKDEQDARGNKGKIYLGILPTNTGDFQISYTIEPSDV